MLNFLFGFFMIGKVDIKLGCFIFLMWLIMNRFVVNSVLVLFVEKIVLVFLFLIVCVVKIMEVVFL